MPIGRALVREGLESGNRVLSNVLQGRDLKESLVNEGKVGIKNLLEKAANNLDEQKGHEGFDFKRYRKVDDGGGGLIGKPKRAKRKAIHKKQSTR